MESFSERLRNAIEQRGLSVTSLAERSEMTRQGLHHLLSDRGRLPTAAAAIRLATALNESLDWLLMGIRPVPDASQTARPHTETLRAAIEIVEGALDELQIDYPPATKAQIIVAVYAGIEASGEAAAARDVVATMLKTVSQTVKT
jgi:transcriptional regulator with XRE-family HTH domain